jgi:predicted ATP-dependent endonuclease of OLD family
VAGAVVVRIWVYRAWVQMKLKSAQVEHFKSITDSGEVDLAGNAICLVGKNESGKTAFLEALYRLNALPTGHRTQFEERFDFPRQRRMRERKTLGKLRPITTTWELDDDDAAAIAAELGQGALADRVVTVSRDYENTRYIGVEIDESAVIAHLLAEARLDRSVAKDAETVEDLRATLAAIAEPSEGQQALIIELAELDANAVAREIAAARMPKFLYFDEYNELPGRISIPFLQNADEASLDTSERTALALLRFAGVEAEDFDEANYEDRRVAIEGARATLTQELFEYWRQNTQLRVDLDLDYKTPAIDGVRVPPYLEVRVENLRHGVTLNFGERSRGFQWFFSFLAAFSQYREGEQDFILLLDEPGLGLHASAQEDFLRYIDEDLAHNHQVIYTTHSPFMVQPTEVERVRLVEDKEKVGTTVSNEPLGVSRDTVFPIQAALGYSLSQSLFLGPDNLVVEGPSDLLYLTAISEHLRDAGRAHLDARWVLVPVGGLEKVPSFIALLGAQLNVAVVVDGAAGGTQRLKEMVDKRVIEADKVLPLSQITGGKEADIEDLFTEAFYVELLNASGVLSKVKAGALPKGNRITARVAKHLEVKPYDHYRPASYFTRHQADWLAKLDEPTLERFETLFGEINQRLS